MKFTQESNRFFNQDENGKVMAEITWQQKGDVLHVDHTFTHPSLRGQGIAAQLVDEVVSFARSNNLKIMPVCPYVVVKFDRDEKYQDIDYRR